MFKPLPRLVQYVDTAQSPSPTAWFCANLANFDLSKLVGQGQGCRYGYKMRYVNRRLLVSSVRKSWAIYPQAHSHLHSTYQCYPWIENILIKLKPSKGNEWWVHPLERGKRLLRLNNCIVLLSEHSILSIRSET